MPSMSFFAFLHCLFLIEQRHGLRFRAIANQQVHHWLGAVFANFILAWVKNLDGVVRFKPQSKSCTLLEALVRIRSLIYKRLVCQKTKREVCRP